MDKKNLKASIDYLHRCYRSDNRQLQLLDFLDGKKVEHSCFFGGEEELLNHIYPKRAVIPELAEALQKSAALFKKEKAIMYGSLFVLGRVKVLGKWRRVCAPLLITEAYLSEKEENYYLHLEEDTTRVNASAFNLLGDNDAFMGFLAKLPDMPLDYGATGTISRQLQKVNPNIDTAALVEYPQLWDEAQIRKQISKTTRTKGEGFSVVPASAFGLVKKSSETYGILAELEDLAAYEEHGEALQALFNLQPTPHKPTSKNISVPTVLSDQQNRALLNARSQLLSLIIGPPGTGKSYTIACIALDHIMRGQSVLITSRQDEAVNVIADKITGLLGSDEIMVRGGAWRSLTPMRRRLRKLLRTTRFRQAGRSKLLQHNLEQVVKQISKVEKQLERGVHKESQRSRLLLKSHWLKPLYRHYLKLSYKWTKAQWLHASRLHDLTHRKINLSKELLWERYEEGVNEVLEKNRPMLEKLHQALKVRSSTERENIFNQIDHQSLLKAFPVWLCKLSELYRVVPMDQELFDVVIIDEASQCDMASPLPAVHRARRVVICGDPNQLRHYSFLSKAHMQQLGIHSELASEEVEKLNFREKSILDLLSAQLQSQNQVSFLDEHYRSVPDIIGFSNRTFYGADLKIMTHRPASYSRKGCQVIYVKGRRNEQGINEQEGFYILQKLKLLMRLESNYPPEAKSSIGLLSPITAQADYLGELILTHFKSEEIDEHHLMAGTPYSFQGEERDVMFLSTAVCPLSHHSALVQINKDDVFNVSITRARKKQWLISSVEARDLPARHLLRQYLDYLTEEQDDTGAAGAFAPDEFTAGVEKYLHKLGFRFYRSFFIADLQLDFLVETAGGLRGIDLIGSAGQYSAAINHARVKLLARAQIPVFPLVYSRWLLQPQAGQEALFSFLHR